MEMREGAKVVPVALNKVRRFWTFPVESLEFFISSCVDSFVFTGESISPSFPLKDISLIVFTLWNFMLPFASGVLKFITSFFVCLDVYLIRQACRFFSLRSMELP